MNVIHTPEKRNWIIDFKVVVGWTSLWELLEMMRYDGLSFVNSNDIEKLRGMCEPSDTTTVWLRKHANRKTWEPTFGRWNSFRISVVWD